MRRHTAMNGFVVAGQTADVRGQLMAFLARLLLRMTSPKLSLLSSFGKRTIVGIRTGGSSGILQSGSLPNEEEEDDDDDPQHSDSVFPRSALFPDTDVWAFSQTPTSGHNVTSVVCVCHVCVYVRTCITSVHLE